MIWEVFRNVDDSGPRSFEKLLPGTLQYPLPQGLEGLSPDRTVQRDVTYPMSKDLILTHIFFDSLVERNDTGEFAMYPVVRLA